MILSFLQTYFSSTIVKIKPYLDSIRIDLYDSPTPQTTDIFEKEKEYCIQIV